ncbi:arrestin domain-containing protein 3-like [Ochlerotatus camptorhynchus]|uniref:arrestin domain-containing protein 3-like n=1 Tax=Ochlerotatus camptorhynchus TaxID=644619 RepID=UPI0031DBF752
MTTSCEIKFDENSYGVYFPGQTLSGSVELRCGEVMKVKGVALQIKGIAEVRWSESTGAGKKRRTVTYSGRHDYMHTTSYLAGSKDGNNIDLLPGIHTYRFSCVLPPNLVTSMEADHGHIRYTVKVTLERSWKTDHSYKVAFTVLRHVNLNEENFDVRLPIKMEKAKTFCCGPCSSDPMLIIAETPISGYVPGQTIAVKIVVDNQSNKKLDELSTKLLRVVSFISQTPYTKVKTVSSIMAEVRCAGVDKRIKGSYVQHLYIPPLPPTSKTCQVLTVNYIIEVEGKISGPAINPKIHIPITLGTIPLTTIAIPTFDNLASMTAPIVVQPMMHAPDAQTPSFPVDLPPPSYEEVVNDNRANIQDEGETNEIGWREYTPRYMVYRFSEEVPSAPAQPALEQTS